MRPKPISPEDIKIRIIARQFVDLIEKGFKEQFPDDWQERLDGFYAALERADRHKGVRRGRR